MWISKERLELEKRVAVQDTLADIIRLSKTKNPYKHTINFFGRLIGEKQTVYEIKAKEIKATPQHKSKD